MSFRAVRDSRISALHGYRLLKICFVAAPILVGLDKFFDVLTNWEQYLSPAARRVLDGHTHLFMHAAECRSASVSG